MIREQDIRVKVVCAVAHAHVYGVHTTSLELTSVTNNKMPGSTLGPGDGPSDGSGEGSGDGSVDASDVGDYIWQRDTFILSIIHY